MIEYQTLSYYEQGRESYKHLKGPSNRIPKTNPYPIGAEEAHNEWSRGFMTAHHEERQFDSCDEE